MKKIILIIAAISLLLGSMASHAEGEFTVRLNSAEAKAGETAEININLENNPGILAMRFNLTYDTDRLELISAEDTELVGGGMFSQTTEKYPYIMLWNSASSSDYSDDGALAVLEFKVKDEAQSGEAFVKLEYDPDDMYNAALEPVVAEIAGGIIKVSGKQSAQPSTSGGGGGGNYSSGSKTEKKEDEKPEEVKEADKTKSQIILTIDKKEALVFGEVRTNDVAPIIVNNRTMLPARFVAESLGAKVEWNADKREVTVTGKDAVIVITIDKAVAKVNGKDEILDSPAFIKNDRTYTPLRFIVENLGAKVEWDEKNRTVTVTK